MCLHSDPNEPHTCYQYCMICWQLSDSVLASLATGSSYTLGTFQELLALADAGCNLCLFLARAFLTSPHGDKFVEEAEIRMEVDQLDRKAPPEITGLSFTIQNPFTSLFAGMRSGYSGTVEIHSWSITLGVFTTDEQPGIYVPQRPADPCVSSDSFFKEAREWISDCCGSHDRCPDESQAGGGLPTRVIDVSAKLGLDRVNIHANPGEKAPYATLSYCWGKSQQYTLQRATLRSLLQDGIEISKLPKTIQDAITVTRKLELRYLWVDSLCIIQDSPEDKTLEISKMPSIYKNSNVTICAAIASDCDGGFLEDRADIQTRIGMSARLPILPEEMNEEILAEGEGDHTPFNHIWLCADKEIGFDLKDFGEEPINQRAWTLQESWLSPRLLIFGSGPPKWQCLTKAIAYGNKKIDKLDWRTQDFFRTRSKFFPSRESKLELHQSDNDQQLVNTAPSRDPQQQLLREWEGVVRLYCDRKLTLKEDRVLALSGLATEFHRLLCDEYLAGIWRISLPYGLLWRCHNSLPPENELTNEITADIPTEKKSKVSKWDRFKRSLQRRSQSAPTPSSGPSSSTQPQELYIAPSWTFLATESPIAIETPFLSDQRTKITIHNASTTPESPLATFGKIVDGSIELTGPIARMSWTVLTERFVMVFDGSPHMFWDYIVPDGGVTNPYILAAAKSERPGLNEQYQTENKITSLFPFGSSSLLTHRNTPPPGTEAELGAQNSDGRSWFWLLEVTWTGTPTGIVLVRLGPSIFKRIGFFRMGRIKNHHEIAINGVSDVGPRLWDWDSCLKMHRIKLV